MKIVRFILNRKYSFFLFLVVLISYGHLLLMYPWQDDHTIFFKLAHIYGKAGFFGYGPIGQGGYKYIITPYIPIYKLFGFNVSVYYFFDILFYFFASFSVYKVLSKVISDSAGKVGGFLFACGYIASDGFLRIFNSIATSSSIILVALLTYYYWSFYKKAKIRYYVFSVILYLLSVELFIIRTHYFLAVVISFEIIFFALRKLPRSFFGSFVRLLPFIYIFYRYFILNGDSRSGEVKGFVLGILQGKFYLLYGWISSITHLTIPDWITEAFHTHLKLGYLLIFFVIFYFVLKNFRNEKNRIISLFFLFSTIVWYFVSKSIFNVPLLMLGPNDFFVAFLGGVVVLSGIIALKKLARFGEKQKLFLFFLVWSFVNIAAYSAYSPTLSYVSIQRYLAHSFFPMISLLAVVFSILQKNKGLYAKLGICLILIWGFGNLRSAFIYQSDIVQNRSDIEKNFYAQLHSYVPTLNKGDVLYFDVSDDARQNFADCFSVASMPEETAIAWTYGIDRYDIRRITSFDDLKTLVKAGKFEDIDGNFLKINNIYSFFYSKSGLVPTSKVLNKDMSGNTVPIPSVNPINLEVTLSTLPSRLSYPYTNDLVSVQNQIYIDPNLIKETFRYEHYKDLFYSRVKATASSEWQESVLVNLVDKNTSTAWRPDRILWHGGKEFLQLDLGGLVSVDKIVWRNAYANNTPTEYAFDISTDSKMWTEVEHIKSVQRIESDKLQVIKIKPQTVRYIRLRLIQSLNDDSPGISEIWVVPSDFSNLDVIQMEQFLSKPFGYVPNEQSFREIFNGLGGVGKVSIYWKNDKSVDWTTNTLSTSKIIYDGKTRKYNFLIPAGGTNISAIKFEGLEIPGEIAIKSIHWEKKSLLGN